MKIGINDRVLESVFRNYCSYIKRPIGMALRIPVDFADEIEITRSELNIKRKLSPEMFELLDDEWEGKRDQITAMLMGWV